MRSPKPVCLLCRLRVAQTTRKTRGVQWRAQAACLSTTSSPASSRRHLAGGSVAAPHDSIISGSASSQSQPPRYLRKVLFERPPKSNVQISQASMTGERSSSRVDALFQQILHEQQGLRDTSGDVSANKGASIDLALVKAISELREMVDGDTPVENAYSYFRSEIYPAIRVPGNHVVPNVYHKVKFELLEKLVEAKKADMFTDGLPAVADIFRLYAETNELKPKQWTLLVGELIRCIVNMNPLAETQSIVKYESQIVLRKAMLADLVESWKILSLPPLAISSTNENQLTNGFWFPRLEKFALSKYANKGNFPAAFSTLFSQYPRNHLGPPVAVLAIATYTLMHDDTRCPVDIRQNATRFMSRVASLVTYVDYGIEALRKDLAGNFPGLEEYVMGLWPKIKANLEQERASQGERSIEVLRIPTPKNKNQSAGVFDAALIGHQLSRVHGTRNSVELDQLWKEFVGSETTISKERAAQIQQHPELIDSFIKTRLKLNQPDKAIVTWNLLGKVGLKPSLRTWNLMLDGLRKTGNIDGIKNIWAKLVRSGLKLDTAIWTTRIAGLIDCNDIEGGLNALEEMSRLWEKDQNKTAVAPTIEPVNAALNGLVQRNQIDAADKLLAWAGRKGIQPDIFTFNTMLRLLIRNGRRDEDVEKLFAAMQAQGVRADEATYTIILDASFSKNSARDPEDQTNIVADVASAMSAAGLELNMQTYGKMIYLLLCSNATAAAMAVVNHLYNRNLELSPHIYTMLIEHCFKQNPPALDSARLLLQRRRHLDFDDMDHIYYDRIVKNYALVGETQAALDTYKHVIKAGSSVNLSTLNDLLQALLRQGRLEDAREMVNYEKKRVEGQHRDPEEHAQFWGKRFWQLAGMYNLLDSPLPSPSLPQE
ncbi:hypothetical protein GQX73_g8598 [Xylaria multiplex]|uniref:Pentacotripeptide-repeat region of PRORP domain-containing protein n=1 Tax=Xylaria multiplex TaxID=323545 RepID=A0A7C8IJ85_9PEZI|nr:hypothetical protein GQX73_g8598 [Xylaria multiplex]